jgi:tetratricopeptide (TPR) repeat protein
MSRHGGKVRVLIPTIAGPVDVLLLTEEDPAIGRSVACIGGSTQIADIDADYNAFVARATGVIERLFGHPCYRLDISGRIDAGSSWQLGVLTAHALRAAGRLAREGEAAECFVWATGSVRSVDLAVGAVSHIGEKFACSFERLEREALDGRSVIVVLPNGNATQITPELRNKLVSFGIDLIEVSAVEPLWNRLGLSPAAVREQVKSRRQLRLRTVIAVFMTALALVAGAAAWVALRQSVEAERRLVIALEASAGITRMATDFRERFGITAPQLTLRLQEADATLQRLSSEQAPRMSLSEIKRTLQRLSEDVGDTPEFRHQKAQTLIALSENYGTLGRTGEQLAHAASARKLLAELGRKGTSVGWERDLARAYVAEGDALRAQGKGTEAFAAYSEALRLRTKIAASAAGETERQKDLASSMSRVGDVLAARGDYGEAYRNFIENLKILERLAAKEPNEARWRRDVAVAHGKIGEVLSSQGDAAGALRSLRESDRIMTELVSSDANNTRWLRELSIWKERVGDILFDRADFANALIAYQSSLKLRQRLTESDPSNAEWQLDLAFGHSKAADALGVSDLRQALTVRQEAHSLITRVASGSDASADARRALLGSHLNLGVNLQRLGNTEAAGTHFQAALDQAEYLVASDPTNAEWRDDLAIALERLGSNLGARGEIDAARAKLERAARARSELVALYPGRRNWRRNLAIVQREMSLILELERNLDGALRLARDAMTTVEELAARDPASRTLQRDLSLSHQRVAEVLLRERRSDAAIGHLEKALTILEVEPEAAGQEWQWQLAGVRGRLADAYLASEQSRLAEEQLLRGRDLAERLHRADPANTAGARTLYTIHARIGHIEQSRGNARRALTEFHRCHDLVAALVARDPQSQALQYDLALTHHSIGDVLLGLPGKRGEALTAYRKAVRILEPLSHSDATNLSLARTLASAHWHSAALLAQQGDREAELKALRTGRATLQRIVTENPGDPILTERLEGLENAYRQRVGEVK